jgi:uncharacterized RDD family membrane protein YckC
MRCPKCRYISFERGDRCRNCGYDFSLTSQAEEPELPLRDAGRDPVGPLADLTLDQSAAAVPAGTAGTEWFELNRTSGRTTDLPLFGRAPAPRAPLGVRRPAQEAPRESRAELPRLRFERPAAAGSSSVRDSDDEADGSIASAPRRLLAGAIDIAIVAGVDLLVLYLTLRLCGLTLADARVLPLVPFVGFLLLLNGGYLASFTAASGQTIGKMAAGIRVVGVSQGEADTVVDRVTFGLATLRTLAYLASALPAGLGFVPAFFGRDRRALHDRLAETRVVRVL